MAGAVLALATGGLIAFGTTPASAVDTGYWIRSSFTSSTPPPYDALVADTRSAADAKCVDTYGFRAREVKPEAWGGGAGNWQLFWRCYRN
jgi:hypothetical protein